MDELDSLQMYGRGIELPHNPNLVTWDKLNENVKKANKDTFINLPKMCDDPNVGLKIVRSE